MTLAIQQPNSPGQHALLPCWHLAPIPLLTAPQHPTGYWCPFLAHSRTVPSHVCRCIKIYLSPAAAPEFALLPVGRLLLFLMDKVFSFLSSAPLRAWLSNNAVGVAISLSTSGVNKTGGGWNGQQQTAGVTPRELRGAMLRTRLLLA